MQIVLLQPLFFVSSFVQIPWDWDVLSGLRGDQSGPYWLQLQGLRVGVMVSLSNIEHQSELKGNGLKKLILHENVNTNDTPAADVGVGNYSGRAASLIFSSENKEENVLWSTEL